MSFAKAYTFTRRQEAGLSHDSTDLGGPTDAGVTQAVYDAYRTRKALPTRRVGEITESEVVDVYHYFWELAQCDHFPEPIDLVVFDWAFNSGVKVALRGLQAVLGVPRDADIGPLTMRLLTASARDPYAFAERLVEAHCGFFLALEDDEIREFGRPLHPGWLDKRTPALRAAVARAQVRR